MLSPRETEVLRLVAQGYTDANIAIRLGISILTVRSTLLHIREKLNYGRCSRKDAGAMRVRLATYAIRKGIITIGDTVCQ